MSAVTDFFSVERADDVWTVRFQPLDYMMFQRMEVTEAMFGLLTEVESKQVKVIRIDFPASSLSPAVVDQFWNEVRDARSVPGGRLDPPVPTLVRTAGTAIARLLRQLRRLTTVCVTSFQGEIDFDLFGVLLVSHYRICAEDTVIVNRVLERDAGPGSAMYWLLARYLGLATANHILMEGKSLTAEEALELKLDRNGEPGSQQPEIAFFQLPASDDDPQ